MSDKFLVDMMDKQKLRGIIDHFCNEGQAPEIIGGVIDFLERSWVYLPKDLQDQKKIDWLCEIKGIWMDKFNEVIDFQDLKKKTTNQTKE